MNVTDTPYPARGVTEDLYFGPPLAWPEITHFSLISICFLLSLVGCVLMMMLMSTPKYRVRSYSVYLRCLVISDVAYSFVSTAYKADSIIAKLLGNSMVFIDTIRPLCAFVFFLQLLLQVMSGWFLVGLSVDRFIAVLYPFKQATMCTARRAKVSCVVIVSLSLVAEFASCYAMVSYIVILDTCSGIALYFYMDLALNLNTVYAFLIPLVVVTAINALIINTINRSRRLQREISTQEQKSTTRANLSLVLVCLVSTVTMLPVSLYYATLLIAPQYALYSLFYPVNVCRAINFCANFYVLMATGTQYRTDMAERLCRQSLA